MTNFEKKKSEKFQKFFFMPKIIVSNDNFPKKVKNFEFWKFLKFFQNFEQP